MNYIIRCKYLSLSDLDWDKHSNQDMTCTDLFQLLEDFLYKNRIPKKAEVYFDKEGDQIVLSWKEELLTYTRL